jgi:hypothetical protein
MKTQTRLTTIRMIYIIVSCVFYETHVMKPTFLYVSLKTHAKMKLNQNKKCMHQCAIDNTTCNSCCTRISSRTSYLYHIFQVHLANIAVLV